MKGALKDLSAYPDNAFDLVISFDAPISYTYPRQEQAIGELVRIAGKCILISVVSRLGSLLYLANSVQKNQFILDECSEDPFVQRLLSERASLVLDFRFAKAGPEKLLQDGLMGGAEEITEHEAGGAPWCITDAFLPNELDGLLREYGVQNVKLAGPGAYARTIPNELLVKSMRDPVQRAEFLEFCYTFDSNPCVCGIGKDNLLARGELQN